jgi:hypothetical protein
MICPFDHIIYITNNLNRLTQEMLEFIQDTIDDNCTLTLENLQAQVRDEFGVEVSKSTIDRGIDSFRYSVKRIQNIAIKGTSN